jgi:hypothetical protein
MLDQQCADLTTVQLLFPGHASVTAVQDDAIVAHGPALFPGRKVNGIQVAADRNAGLRPLLAGVVGIKNMAALANGDQARPRIRNVEHGTADRQGTEPGGQVQHIDVGTRLGTRLAQRQQHHQRLQPALVQ